MSFAYKINMFCCNFLWTWSQNSKQLEPAQLLEQQDMMHSGTLLSY